MSIDKKKILYMRPSKGNNSRSSEDDTSTNEDNVWDDTLLIEAYDKAVKLAQDEVLKKMSCQKNRTDFNKKSYSKPQQQTWKVGDKCRCKYSEDDMYYEADIIDIAPNGMCVIKYIGYDNEEKVLLNNLVPSQGKEARQKQMQQAIAENESMEEVDIEIESDSKNHKEFRQSFTEEKKKNFGKQRDKSRIKKDKFTSNFNNSFFDLPGVSHSPFIGMIPPPPPPCMFSNLTKDDSESEAMSAMLMSWYMSGYHTGYYQGLKSAKKQ